VVIPWLDQPTPTSRAGSILARELGWEDIEYLTPYDELFTVKRYTSHSSRRRPGAGVPGLVAHPQRLSPALVERIGPRTFPPEMLPLVCYRVMPWR
jgi:hypothetical protein